MTDKEIALHVLNLMLEDKNNCVFNDIPATVRKYYGVDDINLVHYNRETDSIVILPSSNPSRK
jgi:hypothetical protein